MIKKTNMNIKGICTDVEDLKDIVGEKDDVYLIENQNGIGYKIYAYNDILSKFVNVESNILHLYTSGINVIKEDYSNIERDCDLLYKTTNINDPTVTIIPNETTTIKQTLTLKNKDK